MATIHGFEVVRAACCFGVSIKAGQMLFLNCLDGIEVSISIIWL
ncbi:hypothetical protein EV14_0639 [Prochlorococcus sp. MIT 0703]|nr:hypothetical protein EV12_0756 [Prochlorococcus sp. MIT 0701]KGG35847.1 hypothetical protein EV14_0639 [Prochlorococcus sp. MIT 0703]